MREYLVLLAYEREIRWFHRHDDEYHLLVPDEQGVLHCQIFPGLNLPPELFWAGDLAGVLAVLQEGLATAEYIAWGEAFLQLFNAALAAALCAGYGHLDKFMDSERLPIGILKDFMTLVFYVLFVGRGPKVGHGFSHIS